MYSEDNLQTEETPRLLQTSKVGMKLADDVYQRVKDALEKLVSITEKSGKLRKDLKEDILKSVSSLRKDFTLKIQLKSEEDKQNKLREEVKNAKEAKVREDSRTTRQVAPSLDHTQKYTKSGVQLVAPSEFGRRKLHSEAVKKEDKRYRITLTPKDEALSPDQITTQLKRIINPTDIEVGIKAIRTIREGRLIIETGSKEEMITLSSKIDNKLGERLEVSMHRLRKPRLIIFNVPEEITTQNVATIIKDQNPKIQSNGEDIEAKYKFKDRKGRHNIVMEVGPR
jgi:hypothetical protein